MNLRKLGWPLPVWCAVLLMGCVADPAQQRRQPSSAVPATQTASASALSAPIVATAHPLATQAGLQMLAQGGSAVDAAIAAQLMLGLVEPQSSGLGGGLLLLHWDAVRKRVSSIDGLAAAPQRTTASLRTDVDGQLLPADASQRGGRTVGVPGALPALVLAHQRHGRLDWAALVAPARDAAETGFPMPRYLHAVLSPPETARELRKVFPLYFDIQGQPLPVGTLIRHQAYGKTMREIARLGPQRWWAGRGTTGLLEAAQQGFRPSLMTAADVAAYRAVEREPVCAAFLAHRVCTSPPPSFGGIAVLQILQLVEARAAGRYDFHDPAFLHLYAEAGKLAQADRRWHVGDPDHVPVPTRGMVSAGYIVQRAGQIDTERAASQPAAGHPAAFEGAAFDAPGPFGATRSSPVASDRMKASEASNASYSSYASNASKASMVSRDSWGSAGNAVLRLVPDTSPTDHAQTSQLAVADAQGNVVSVTTTNNLNFGSRLAFDGVVLNNAMTNFSAAPGPGERLANQMAPGKRPITSMAPTIVFDPAGRPVVAGGSAGGGPIVDYVAASLIGMLANGNTPAQAVAAPQLTTAIPGVLQLERARDRQAQAAQLRAMGHAVESVSLPSGQVFIRKTEQGWTGAADPRRDGNADTLRPQ